VIATIVRENPILRHAEARDWPGLEKIRVASVSGGRLVRPVSILAATGGLFLDISRWSAAMTPP